MEFIAPLNRNINTDSQFSLNLGLMYKVIPTEGNMAWEYNPFRNYRITEPKYYFRNKFFSKEELELELDPTGNIKISENNSVKDWEDFKYPALPNGIKDYEDDPIFYDKNQLADFDTNELKFDINHPVDILPQYSYDGSVNLILNDGKNPPRLINSRFSSLGKGKYQIVDRKGDNDTNIYDQGSQFESDTSLYKTYVGIPKLEFINVYSNGNLPVGNYCFYFKYVDADGNETDFVAESGLVSIFKGQQYGSIHSGFRNENSYKSVKFLISNIDSAYQYISVYYTRNSADIDENPTTSAFKINQKFLVNNSFVSMIYITGDEDTSEISIDEINTQYQISDNVQTQAACQNMLFFGNITDSSVDYKELSDLSLRFCAYPDVSKSYTPVSHLYGNKVTDTYADPKFIYNYTGYQNHEIYRFGVVYLMSNGTLSPVYNIRGMFFNRSDQEYTNFNVKKNESLVRNYISYNEETGIIYKTDSSKSGIDSLENAFGVVKLESGLDTEFENVLGIRIGIDDKEELFKEFSKYKIKGYFFVRQKRIPLRLCQALTLGVDNQSNTPLLYGNNTITINSESKDKLSGESEFYVAERFLSDDRLLLHAIEDRRYCIKKSKINKFGAICPDYDINQPYYNSLFCGDQYLIEQVSESTPLSQDSSEFRHLYIDNFTYIPYNNRTLTPTRVLGVEDNTQLIEVGSKLFSARAGNPEEAYRYEYIYEEIKTTECNNLLRGSFGPYIAFDGSIQPGALINIYIQDYGTMDVKTLLKLRINDKSPYYAISERFDITEVPKKDIILYRGDTYICTFTHRFNRNFQDPKTPTNHQIVDEDCWKENFEVKDGVVDLEKFDKINLGDVNAVKIGTWVTFSVVSSNNLNIRSIDDSHVDETLLTGHPRGFFPYYGMSADGSYKTPESLCFNKGFTKVLSEKYYFEVSDVPAMKNDFTNRILYSDIHVNDAFKNGFRTFRLGHYRDYPKTYGQITKLIEFRGNLICVFEHGIALIAVNERALAGEGAGGNVFINTSNVLPENPMIISDTFGSQWKDSVIKTPLGIYGVDTIGKKIWRTDGTNFECISNFRVQEFLNQNITLSERELEPIIGIRNVKTHYNKFKNDVMFTFYDNLYGFEEKVWNLCYNELLNKFITFYSWVPSYSENIYNQLFTFDRNTSKWIAKLGVSKSGNDFSDGVCLSNNIIPNDACDKIGELSLENRTLPSGDGITVDIDYEIVNKEAKKMFLISKDNETKKSYLQFNNHSAKDLCAELFVRGSKDKNGYTQIITDPIKQRDEWYEKCVLNKTYCVCKDDLGRRINLDKDKQLNANRLVFPIDIKADIKVTYTGEEIPSLAEAYTSGFKNGIEVNAGYYQSTIMVTTKYNMQFLTTDFWKHGQAGIIDIADKIYPTYWYGKQHPFEFEFVVAENPQLHKIFDNLEIISNNAEPESFHYEIIGDSYEFSKDKKNMYIRQEATKELFQFNGSDILFNSDYVKLDSEHRRRYKIENGNKIELQGYDKSTLFPLYYYRQDDFNNIEDSYHLKDGIPQSKDFSALSGAEIVHYDTLQEYRIWNHAKAINISDDTKGRLRGNMQYKEDRWHVQINPINLVQKNESDWLDHEGNVTTKVPVEVGQYPLPSDISNASQLSFPNSKGLSDRGYTIWNWEESQNKEVKLKDKWVKIRIRYKGDKIAIITAIKTLYSASYS